MSYTNKVLQAMNFDQATLSSITRVPEKEVGQILYLLAQGWVIELVEPNRYRKNRKYTTNQRQMFA